MALASTVDAGGPFVKATDFMEEDRSLEFQPVYTSKQWKCGAANSK